MPSVRVFMRFRLNSHQVYIFTQPLLEPAGSSFKGEASTTSEVNPATLSIVCTGWQTVASLLGQPWKPCNVIEFRPEINILFNGTSAALLLADNLMVLAWHSPVGFLSSPMVHLDHRGTPGMRSAP